MTGFTIFCFVLLSIALHSFYVTVWKANPAIRFFFLKQGAWQVLAFVLSFFSLYLLALGGTGHHVETDLENTLGDICSYILLSNLVISFVGLIIVIIKGLKK